MSSRQQAEHTLAALSSLYRLTPLPGAGKGQGGSKSRGPRRGPDWKIREDAR